MGIQERVDIGGFDGNSIYGMRIGQHARGRAAVSYSTAGDSLSRRLRAMELILRMKRTAADRPGFNGPARRPIGLSQALLR